MQDATLPPSPEVSDSSTISATALLRASLLDGAYAPGTRLNEMRLAQTLGISRTPVRAALQTLAGEGLLLHQPNRGFTVRGFALSDIVDAFELRALAEGLAARLAAERGLSLDAEAVLQAALEEGDALLAAPAPDAVTRATYARINEDIHGTIHAAAGSALVRDVIRFCQRVPQSAPHNVVAFELEDVRSRHEAHHRIIEAILLRAPRQAEELMRDHVLSLRHSLVRHLARRGSAERTRAAPRPAASQD